MHPSPVEISLNVETVNCNGIVGSLVSDDDDDAYNNARLVLYDTQTTQTAVCRSSSNVRLRS